MNLSKLGKLKTLRCYTNILTELDLSNMPNLELLICDQNNIKYLDVACCPKLETIICDQSVKVKIRPDQNRISDPITGVLK